jgi:type II secretory pathway component GspD/PulD (secretin)
VNGNPSITTQRAETYVQVPDGVTTVIGGILQSSETNTEDRTPGVSRIPLLGWLFKRTDSRVENQELLISITPRIIR